METKICKCCGEAKSIADFAKNPLGVTSFCKECMRKKQSEGHKKRSELKKIEEELEHTKDARLSEFTPRELMKELARRGYKGELQYVSVQKISIDKL